MTNKTFLLITYPNPWFSKISKIWNIKMARIHTHSNRGGERECCAILNNSLIEAPIIVVIAFLWLCVLQKPSNVPTPSLLPPVCLNSPLLHSCIPIQVQQGAVYIHHFLIHPQKRTCCFRATLGKATAVWRRCVQSPLLNFQWRL